MGIPEMAQVGGWIHRVLVEPEKEASIRQIRSEVLGLTQQFPIPQ
jgi:glycine/serine hydroxymethyltransferase